VIFVNLKWLKFR